MELSALAPFVFSALLCMGISPVLIPYLHRLKFDQTIRENGPTWHNAKGKTPTMGGLAFVAGTTAGVLLGGLVCLGRMPTNAVLVLLCALSFGFVGFIDDYIKVVKKRNLGLTPAQKLVLQVLAAAAFLWAARIAGWTSTSLAIPFWNKSIELSLLYYPVAAVIVIGTVNAVNLTDGLDGLASCVKHFAAYGLVEAGQDYGHVDVSRVEMYNTYLPPFKAALDAGCDMLMPAFTPVDRVPATANRWLIGQVLRQQWAWDGMIITDWGSIDMMLVQAFAESMEEAVEQAFNNTVDMDMMSYAYFSCLEKLIREGKVREEKLDASVLRILELKNRLGLMDDSRQPQPAPTAEQVAENRRKTLQAALQSCVLMKNDGVLPLKPGVHLALAGSHADEHGLLGGWHTDGRNEETPSLLDAFRAEKNVTLCKPEEADVILFACGEQQDLTGEACSRAYPKLEEEQLQELYALSELGKPIVMVLFCGRALVLSDALPFCNALLNAWFPGSEGAEAIRRLLVGEENPSGHLPVTFPRCTGQLPIHHDRIPTGRPYTTEENRYSCRYLDEKNAPLFPFGFGLSYTQFEISDICADTDVIQANEPFHVTAKVRNAGNRAGETVIQLYSNVHVPGQLTPVRSLTDWQRICLGVGQQMEVTFELTLAQLSQLDAEGRAVTPRGKVRIAVGEDSHAPFTVTLPVEA